MGNQTGTHTTTYPPLVSVAEAGKILGGRGRGKIYKLIDSKEIDSVKDGSRRMIITDSIFAYIETLKHSREDEDDQSDEVRDATGSGIRTERW